MVEHLPPLPWLILFAPLAACVLIALFLLDRPRAAAMTSLAGILTSLAGSAGLYLFHSDHTRMPAETAYEWIRIPGVAVEFGFLIDPLSILMLLVVTGVGSCIFLYSTSYMHGDKSYARYFASLSLFAFSMIGIVLSNNFLMLFVFWELVAVSSYLLIGFWFEKPSAADAGNKAFIVNRVADFGMVLGIFFVWMLSGAGGAERTFGFLELAHRIPEAAHAGLIAPAALGLAALLVFCGVVGKSAQFPLYIWLPDAMEGPTPVSALIHAATMVAAGVFMMSRVFFLLHGLDAALEAIAWIGCVTALLAAGLAVVQNDIKKILAYSTISQLGYMVMALGLGSSEVAMYHLTTHAFFKALLFLGAGAMIHGLHTQDIWEMGGLRKDMPVTAWTFLLGTLALCGIAPLSGFFSKDEVLTLAFEHHPVLFSLALFTAALTAFYMSRALNVAVFGARRAKKHAHGHAATQAHDAPWPMKLPLLVLALLTVAGGFMGIPAFIAGGGHGEGGHHGPAFNWTVAALSTAAAVAGLALGTWLYRGAKGKEDPIERPLGPLYRTLVNKYYLDDLFSAIGRFFQGTAARLLLAFDLSMIQQKGVGGAAQGTAAAGSLLRRMQTGRVQTYAMIFAFGVIGLAWLLVAQGAK